MKELQKQVVQWAQDKGLLSDVTPERIEKQTLKVLEELGETAGAYLKGNREELIDGIGDIAVTIIILAEMKGETIDSDISVPAEVKSKLLIISHLVCGTYLESVFAPTSKNTNQNLSYAIKELELFALYQDLELWYCLKFAYDVISKRTGKIVGDTFIKD